MIALLRIIIVASLLTACASAKLENTSTDITVAVSSPLIVREKNCFEWGANYAAWVTTQMGAKASPKLQQRIERNFPQALYDEYSNNLICKRFIYRVDGLMVEGFYAAPKQVITKIPAIIFNRGGNGSFSKIGRGLMLNKILPLANEGFFVIASQYRGAGSTKNNGFDEFGGRDINDVLALLEIIDATKGVDNQSVGLYGWSRGGIMSFLAAKHSSRFSAIAVGGAPTDLWASLQAGWRPEMERVYRKRIPHYTENKQQSLVDRSAVYWLDELQSPAPVLILHGNNDENVHVSDALRLAEKLQEANRSYKLIIYDEGNHGLIKQKDEVHQEVIKWFRKHFPVSVNTEEAGSQDHLP
jgi:dipeptidyl aminopeptidase/acylaminoacyl peptidase